MDRPESLHPMNPEFPFYIVGGTVPRDAPSYISRQADDDLHASLRRGEFCYVLTSRQMGKSSLMVRTAARLREEGVAVASLDLTAVGQNLTVAQWYDGLLHLLARALDLEDALEEFWFSTDRFSPMQRWMITLREMVLEKIPGNIVLFVDEIDAVRSLPFSADEFFAAIRECYNRRAQDPAFSRLTFCLLGVATPSDLIKDTRTTPFNIGRRIELTDFTEGEAAPLARGLREPLGGRPEPESSLLSRILYWTGGHPYLTQRLCQAVAEALPGASTAASVSLVDRVCADLFLSAKAREKDDNLIFVRERLLRSEEDVAAVLDLYANVRRGQAQENDETNPRVSVLQLSGVVRAMGGKLAVRNRIYARVFDGAWVRDNLPGAEVRRQQAAFRRGVWRTAAIFSAILLVMGALVAYAVSQKLRADRWAESKQQETLRATQSEIRANRDEQKAQGEADKARRLAGRLNAALNDLNAALFDVKVQRNAAVSAAKRESAEKGHVEAAFQEAERQRHIALVSLGASHLAEAEAARYSGRSGQQFEALALIQKAIALHPDAAQRARLRDVAIAALALPTDARLVRCEKRNPAEPFIQQIDWALGRRYLLMPDGTCRVERMDSGLEVGRIRVADGKVTSVGRMSPDGRFVTVVIEKGKTYTFGLWDLQQGRIKWQSFRRDRVPWTVRVDFALQRPIMAVETAPQIVSIIDLPSFRVRDVYNLHGDVSGLRLSRDGRKLALGTGPTLHVLDVDNGSDTSIASPTPSQEFAWHPDGIRLAANGEDAHVYIWDTRTRQVLHRFAGHTGRSHGLEFNHRGDLLVSLGWDEYARIWNPETGRQVLAVSAGGLNVAFSPDDRMMRVFDDNKSTSYKLAPASICRTLQGRAADSWNARVSPDGRLIAVPTHSRSVEIWDVERGCVTGGLQVETASALFASDGRSIYTSGPTGSHRWAIAGDLEGDGSLRVGPKEQGNLLPRSGSYWAGLSRDGTLLAASGPNSTVFVNHLDKQEVAATPEGQGEIHGFAVSPDDRWVAAGSWQALGTRVWDVGTMQRAFAPPFRVRAHPAFSPDGKWFVSCGSDAYRFYEPGSWRPGFVLPMDSGSRYFGAIDFTADSRIMAVTPSRCFIDLYDTRTYKRFARLESPEQVEYSSVSFSADGSCLAAACARNRLQIWDLRRLRQRLKALGLDWDTPPIAPQRALPTDPLHLIVQEPGAEDPARAHISEMKERGLTHPNDPAVQNSLAWILVTCPERLREPKQAVIHALRAVELGPNDANRINTLGVVYYRLGDYPRAIATLEESLRLSAGSVDGLDLIFLAMAHQRLGHTPIARDCFDRAIRWTESKTDLAAEWKEEWKSFRAEAETVLGIGNRSH